MFLFRPFLWLVVVVVISMSITLSPATDGQDIAGFIASALSILLSSVQHQASLPMFAHALPSKRKMSTPLFFTTTPTRPPTTKGKKKLKLFRKVYQTIWLDQVGPECARLWSFHGSDRSGQLIRSEDESESVLLLFKANTETSWGPVMPAKANYFYGEQNSWDRNSPKSATPALSANSFPARRNLHVDYALPRKSYSNYQPRRCTVTTNSSPPLDIFFSKRITSTAPPKPRPSYLEYWPGKVKEGNSNTSKKNLLALIRPVYYNMTGIEFGDTSKVDDDDDDGEGKTLKKEEDLPKKIKARNQTQTWSTSWPTSNSGGGGVDRLNQTFHPISGSSGRSPSEHRTLSSSWESETRSMEGSSRLDGTR